jgi:hypothetical protein
LSGNKHGLAPYPAQKALDLPEVLWAQAVIANAAIHRSAKLPANGFGADHGRSLSVVSWFTRIDVRAFIMRTTTKKMYQKLPFAIVG